MYSKKRNSRIMKKLNKRAMELIIQYDHFTSEDFEDDGSMMYICSQSENGDDWSECQPYHYLCEFVWWQTMIYEEIPDHYDENNFFLREKILFTVKNPSQAFRIYIEENTRKY